MPPASPSPFPPRRSSDLDPPPLPAGTGDQVRPQAGAGEGHPALVVVHHDVAVGGHCPAAGLEADGVRHRVGQVHQAHLPGAARSEEHTSELQSRGHLVCRPPRRPLSLRDALPISTRRHCQPAPATRSARRRELVRATPRSWWCTTTLLSAATAQPPASRLTASGTGSARCTRRTSQAPRRTETVVMVPAGSVSPGRPLPWLGTSGSGVSQRACAREAAIATSS